MNDFLDLAIAPEPGFADLLERRLMEDMGWASAGRSPRAAAARRRRIVTFASAALLAAAMIVLAVFFTRGDDGPEPPVTTVTPSTTPAATSTTTTPTTPTTPAPPQSTTGGAGSGAVPLPQQTTLEPGTLYNAGKAAIGAKIQFTPPSEGVWSYSSAGLLGLTLDRGGAQALINVVDLGRSRVFLDPLVDFAPMTNDELDAITAAAPDDYFDYLASLPGVEIGPVEDAEFAGLPARSVRYEVGPFDGGQPCFQQERGARLATLWVRVAAVLTYWAGDSGTLYELEIGDRTVIVDVSDRPGARELASTFTIDG